MAEGLRCTESDALWLSDPATVVISQVGGCLASGGRLEVESPPALPEPLEPE